MDHDIKTNCSVGDCLPVLATSQMRSLGFFFKKSIEIEEIRKFKKLRSSIFVGSPWKSRTNKSIVKGGRVMPFSV